MSQRRVLVVDDATIADSVAIRLRAEELSTCDALHWKTWPAEVQRTRSPSARMGRGPGMDIADLILEDHHRQRRAFAVLDDTHPEDLARLGAIWGDLAAFLETHAAAEEKVLYPEVLKLSDPDASETKDAIGDHNDIRDAIAVAQTHATGTAGWWQAVGAARSANTEHMGEEEDDVLPAFRRRAGVELRVRLGVAFEAAKSTSSAQELDISDKDPEQYVNERT